MQSYLGNTLSALTLMSASVVPVIKRAPPWEGRKKREEHIANRERKLVPANECLGLGGIEQQ